MQKVNYKDLGLISYSEALKVQENYFNKNLEEKKSSGKGNTRNTLLFCEHKHVYTLGKSGAENNLLINDAFLKSINAEYYKSSRGGDITYHGPGQIVSYPILDLEKFNFLARKYIYNLEEVIIETLKEYNIKSERLDGATGVWLDTDNPLKTRKICAIGVKVSRWISMHGFAFNINTDLSYFKHINPCGFSDKEVTSLKKELGKEVNIDEVKTKLLKNFSNIFGIEII
jgi:lipoyl(octanoyl) transferase